MKDLPYLSALRTVGEPVESALAFVKQQEERYLRGLVAEERKNPVGDVVVVEVDDGPLPAGQHTFEFRQHHTC
jgi:hypothetical protein